MRGSVCGRGDPTPCEKAREKVHESRRINQKGGFWCECGVNFTVFGGVNFTFLCVCVSQSHNDTLRIHTTI